MDNKVLKDNKALIECIRVDIYETIQYGNFTLHVGQKSNWICDMVNIRHWFSSILHILNSSHMLFGIEFGGALLAYADSPVIGIIRKDGSVYVPYIGGRWPIFSSGITLIDDVATTETSMKMAEQALKNYNISIADRFAILDRRKPEHRTLEIKSLFTPSDFNLSY